MKSIILVSVLLISLSACSIFQPTIELDTTQTITGTVRENNIDVPADGNNTLLIETESGTFNVLYQEGGLLPPDEQGNQCHNNPLMAQFAQTLVVGDSVEIYGAAHTFYDIEICSRTDYYITVIQPQTPQTSARIVRGEVTERINDCAFDGNCGFVIITDDNQEITVIYAEGMSMNCRNDMFNGQSNDDIQVGDTIEANGTIINANTISACGDTTYYITKQEE